MNGAVLAGLIDLKKSDLLRRKVEDYAIAKGEKASSLVEKMGGAGGFTAKNLALAADALGGMLGDGECTRILSFPADVVSTGLRGVLAQAVKHFDCIITTCGTLDHDLARAWGKGYFHGAFDMDDRSLHQIGVNRLGNVLVPNESYGEVLENKMQPILRDLAAQKADWGGRELIAEFGKKVSDENSILHQACKHNVPVYVPGITDGAFGTNLMMFAQDKKFSLNLLRDEKELSDIIYDSKRLGALMMGGGISKHHVIWWSQFKGGLDYAVYITTATQYDGSLSGARLEEAISWGKVKERARMATVDGDVTVILPLLLAAVYENL
ncbi:putative deoxyhypusine synthase [Candidatus Burarchaeum australiense]|nr:putative deoxyhypusine synthase [Candidatus Burarchaeum australiense]